MYHDIDNLSRAERFWSGESWPTIEPPGYVFLGRAVQALGRAMFDTWSDTDPQETFQLFLNKQRESTAPPAIERFSKVQRQLIQGCAQEDIDAVVLFRTGRTRALPAHWWLKPQSTDWFFLCLVNPWEPESRATDSADHCLIFVSRPMLRAFIQDRVWTLDDDAREQRHLIRQGRVLELTATPAAAPKPPQLAHTPEDTETDTTPQASGPLQITDAPQNGSAAASETAVLIGQSHKSLEIADRPLATELLEIAARDSISFTAAARIVLKTKKAQGHGDPESIVRRLVRRAKNLARTP